MARAPATVDIDVMPECDRLDGVPHPRETAAVIGHDGARAAFEAAGAGGRLHHAWLIAGPQGIGKATLAYGLARRLLTGRDGNARLVDQQVRALSHPGLIVIRRPYDPKTKRFPATIPVDEVRRLRDFLGRTAEADAWRVVIVDSADELNPNAANALLKALEEPPARTVFLMPTVAPQRLLPTIRSRCRIMALAPLSDGLLLAAARAAWAGGGSEAPDEATLCALLPVAQGSVRRLIALAMGDGVKLRQRVDALIASLPRIDWAHAHALADELAASQSTEKLDLFHELLLGRIHGLVRAASGAPASAEDVADAARLGIGGALASWAELWESIVRDKAETLALNLDRRLLVLDTLARVARTAQEHGSSG